MIEVKPATEADFQVTEQDLINRTQAKEEQRKATPSTPSEQKPEASLAPASTPPQSTSTQKTFLLQVYPNPNKLQALQVVLQAMDIDFVVLQEVRG